MQKVFEHGYKGEPAYPPLICQLCTKSSLEGVSEVIASEAKQSPSPGEINSGLRPSQRLLTHTLSSTLYIPLVWLDNQAYVASGLFACRLLEAICKKYLSTVTKVNPPIRRLSANFVQSRADRGTDKVRTMLVE